jgi:predicted transcriptional regulator
MSRMTIRVSDETHSILHELATLENTSMQDILGKAVEEYRRKRFLDGLNEDFARLREKEDLWAEEIAERTLWTATLLDGQETE